MANRLQIEDKFDTLNEELHKIALAIGGEVSKPTTWEEIKILCRNNKIRGLLEVGETREFTKDGVKYNAVVMDFIEEGQHSSGLKLRDGLQTGVIFQVEKIMYNLQFDEREAFYCATSGLASGTYHFLLKEHTWYASDIGKSFQFTLGSAIPNGAQLVFKQAYNATLVGASVDVFADGNSRTPLMTVTLSEGAGGTDLGELKNSINGDLNSCQRALFGSNRYKDSAMRQHLNSDAEAGFVWTPQTKWDRPPLWFANTKGFLNGLQKDLAESIVKVDRHVYRNTLSDGGGLDEITESIFLPSRKEVYMTAEGADDTEPWAFYKEASAYDAPNASADPCRVKYRMDNNQPYYWWLESPYVGTANNVRRVDTAGATGSYDATSSGGVAPAFVIA